MYDLRVEKLYKSVYKLSIRWARMSTLPPIKISNGSLLPNISQFSFSVFSWIIYRGHIFLHISSWRSASSFQKMYSAWISVIGDIKNWKFRSKFMFKICQIAYLIFKSLYLSKLCYSNSLNIELGPGMRPIVHPPGSKRVPVYYCNVIVLK